jgi:hypothetical protein
MIFPYLCEVLDKFTPSVILSFYFIFEFAYINDTGNFIGIIPYMHTVYFEQIHPLHYIPIPLFFPLFFKQYLVSFKLSCVCVAYFNPSYPSVSLLFFLPPSISPPISSPYDDDGGDYYNAFK